MFRWMDERRRTHGAGVLPAIKLGADAGNRQQTTSDLPGPSVAPRETRELGLAGRLPAPRNLAGGVRPSPNPNRGTQGGVPRDR